MKKEVLLAIIIGLIFGLVITFGIYQANRYAMPSKQAEAAPTPTPTPNETTSLVSLISPSDGDIFSVDVATISGTVQEGVFLTLLAEGQEFFVGSKDNHFSVEIDLITGANLVQIIALTAEGQRQEIKLNLVYTTAKLVE